MKKFVFISGQKISLVRLARRSIRLSLCLALRYHQIIETVQPANLWQPTTDSFMSNVSRPYPAQQAHLTSSSLAQLTNPNSMYLATSYPSDAIDLSVPSVTTFPSTNYFSSTSDRVHPSPSSNPAAFPPLFSYMPTSFNHHHHHHYPSTVDDNSLLIPNPSLT